MATFTLMKDEMKTCPYNPLHKVAARRLQAHIIKCQRNTANPVLVECPFNALHRVLPSELQQHVLLCKDSRQVIREIEELRTRPALNNPVVQRTELPVASDDWDEEIDKNAETYVIPGLLRDQKIDGDEEEGKERPFTIKSQIQIQGMAPAERKKYYKLLAEKAKAKELPEIKSEFRIKEEREGPPTSSRSQSTVTVDYEDTPNNVRNPKTIPFKKFVGGIGRGNTPLASRIGVRQVGSSPSPLADSSVKREWDDSSNYSAKRFSP